MRIGIVARLVWGKHRYKIYQDLKTNEYYLYDRNEEVFNAPSFNEVYAFSLKYRKSNVLPT